MRRYPQVIVNVRRSPTATALEASSGLGGRRRRRDEPRRRGRVLVRASGTEPLVRVMVEADRGRGARATRRRSPPPCGAARRPEARRGSAPATLDRHVRHRGLRGARRGPPDHPRRSPPARVPRLRLRGRRRRSTGASRVVKRAGKLAELEDALAARAAPRRLGRHGAHALGDARRADRPQRAPAPRLHRPRRRDPQRHHREPPGAARPAGEGRPHVRLGDRHRVRGAPAGGAAPDGGRPRRRRCGRPSRELEGAYALVVVLGRDPERARRREGLLAARRGSGGRRDDPRIRHPGGPGAHHDGDPLDEGQIVERHARRRSVHRPRGRGRCTRSRSRSTGTSRARRSAATTRSCARRSTSSPPRSATRSSGGVDDGRLSSTSCT